MITIYGYVARLLPQRHEARAISGRDRNDVGTRHLHDARSAVLPFI